MTVDVLQSLRELGGKADDGVRPGPPAAHMQLGCRVVCLQWHHHQVVYTIQSHVQQSTVHVAFDVVFNVNGIRDRRLD